MFHEDFTANSLQYWRKKFRQNKIELTAGSPNLQNGIYREYNTPMPLMLCYKMVAYAVGDRGRVNQILHKHVKHIGKKRAYGKGRVINVEVDIVDYDYSLYRNGAATRFLPHESGSRKCRVRPPYWNNIGKVACCEIGDILKSGVKII